MVFLTFCFSNFDFLIWRLYKGNAAAKGTPRFLFDLTRYFIPEIDVV